MFVPYSHKDLVCPLLALVPCTGLAKLGGLVKVELPVAEAEVVLKIKILEGDL